MICYILFFGGAVIVDELLLCNPIEGRTTDIEVFRNINYAIVSGKLQWKDWVRIFTDGAQAVFGIYYNLQAPGKKESPWINALNVSPGKF